MAGEMLAWIEHVYTRVLNAISHGCTSLVDQIFGSLGRVENDRRDR